MAVVRRNLGVRAVGHAGTLDPFATGLLVVLVGRATRLARFVESEVKRYAATVRFGTATDTDDATGTVVRRGEPTTWFGTDAIAATLGVFTGAQLQRPPAYSAKHVDGTRAHRLARQGTPVALPPTEVMVHALEVASWAPPDLRLWATVGKGTYLRALARDLGEHLGVPAHCAALRRESIGEFTVAEAIAPQEASTHALRPPLAMVPHLPQVALDDEAAHAVGFGRTVARESEVGPVAALVSPAGSLMAVATATGDGWQPTVVLEPAA